MRSFHNSLDHAIVWLGRRRIQVAEGEYDAEALRPLCDALDAIVCETRAVLAEITEPLRDLRKMDGDGVVGGHSPAETA